MNTANPTTIAAIDLGSNSFHLLVARADGDNFRVVDRMRHMVRLAAGMSADNQLNDKAVARALSCLAQFGERVRGLPRDSVRVVGTNALRKARRAAGFINQAEAALGHPIDIISGHEEARLIYLGVSHGLDDAADMRLVIDIGGGSTEFILGRCGLSVAGKGIGAIVAKGVPPVANAVDADSEPPGDLREGEPLIGDHADGLDLELAGVRLPWHGVVLAESLHP